MFLSFFLVAIGGICIGFCLGRLVQDLINSEDYDS